VKPHEYRDLLAAYIEANFGGCGLAVYTEVSFGKTIIGKNRQLDLLILRASDQTVLGLEAKYQEVPGTTDEKIPYALQDLEALWIPGCLVYAGAGWSKGVLHTLEGSHRAAYCLPLLPDLTRTRETRELDHVLAAVFGLWDRVLPEARLYRKTAQLTLPLKGPRKAMEVRPSDEALKKSGGEE
jgi:hypothetical protein